MQKKTTTAPMLPSKTPTEIEKTDKTSAKKNPLITSTSKEAIKALANRTATAETIQKPSANIAVNDPKVLKSSVKSSQKQVKDSGDILHSADRPTAKLPKSKIKTSSVPQNSECVNGHKDTTGARSGQVDTSRSAVATKRVFTSKTEEQMHKIQEFLKDPENPDEKVKINFRLKNKGNEYEVREVVPGLHVASLEALNRPDLQKFDLVVLSSARSHPELVHQNILQIYPGEEREQLGQLHQQTAGRKQILISGDGGDPAALAAVIISKRNKTSLNEAVKLIKAGQADCKINQAIILRLNEEADKGSSINWKVWVPAAFISFLLYYMMKRFFDRLEEEHKEGSGGGEDYSYFNILRWP